MGFRYKNTLVTLENYKTIYKDCSVDILDEIRSAILDDTPIASYINECGTDSYKLGQIRMGIREMLPLGLLNPLLTGRTLYLIRQSYKVGFDLEPLFRYIEDDKLLLKAMLPKYLRVIKKVEEDNDK